MSRYGSLAKVYDLPSPPAPEPTDAELREWGDRWFGSILERRASNRRRWCARWWEHPEVVTRVRILALSHHQVLKDGDALAMSAWLLDHLDRHLEAVMASDGPFAGCSPERHTPHGGLRSATRLEMTR